VAITINVLFGLPNDRKAPIIVHDDGRSISFDLLGSVGMLPYLSRSRFNLAVRYLEPGGAEPAELASGPLLNHVAEPDSCSDALRMAERVVGKMARPCFNHPHAIARTTRDEVAYRLAGIEGLKVPKTIRIRERTGAEVRAAIERAHLSFPVLVRIAGFHLGMSLIKVDVPDQLDGICADLDRDERSSLYVTEFCDFAGADGLYRKYRIAVVGDEIFLRHLYIGASWLIHRARTIPGTEPEERSFLDAFEPEWVPRLRPMFQEIGRRLQLDFFGVDCNIDPAGDVLLFEANACMKILGYTGPKPNIWEAPIARITAAVEDRLSQPETWCCLQADFGAR
jgi:glutathione synthase/RimK-type ligase-like ATP-grasp enzyme